MLIPDLLTLAPSVRSKLDLVKTYVDGVILNMLKMDLLNTCSICIPETGFIENLA